MKEAIPRKLYRDILGYYSNSCFRIGIETNFAFKNMTAKDYSVFAHEYMHYLQDISTTYGAFCAYSLSEYIKSVAKAIRLSTDGRIEVPYTPEPGDDNVFANVYIRSYTYGDYNEIDEVKDIIEIHTINETIDSKDLDSIPLIELVVLDGHGRKQTLFLGACAVMESLAFMMENYIAPEKTSAPDFPYKIAERMVKTFHPDFAKDILNIIALCDVSLLSSSPGYTFAHFLLKFKDNDWLPDRPEDVYSIVLTGGYKVSGSKPCYNSYEEEMDKMRKIAIDSLETYFNDSMIRFRKWIEGTYNRGFALRIKQPYFILDIARGGDIRQNPFIRFLIEDLVGTPIMTNSLAEATIKSPIVHFESDFFLFPAVGEIIKLFYYGECNCNLKPICEIMRGVVDDKCNSAPWSHEVNIVNMCPYSLLWHNWSFSKCKPVMQKE